MKTGRRTVTDLNLVVVESEPNEVNGRESMTGDVKTEMGMFRFIWYRNKFRKCTLKVFLIFQVYSGFV